MDWSVISAWVASEETRLSLCVAYFQCLDEWTDLSTFTLPRNLRVYSLNNFNFLRPFSDVFWQYLILVLFCIFSFPFCSLSLFVAVFCLQFVNPLLVVFPAFEVMYWEASSYYFCTISVLLKESSLRYLPLRTCFLEFINSECANRCRWLNGLTCSDCYYLWSLHCLLFKCFYKVCIWSCA